MVFEERKFTLKDGREALLRTPREEDAEEMLRFITRASGETAYLMRYPEDGTRRSLRISRWNRKGLSSTTPAASRTS